MNETLFRQGGPFSPETGIQRGPERSVLLPRNDQIILRNILWKVENATFCNDCSNCFRNDFVVTGWVTELQYTVADSWCALLFRK